MNWFFASGDAPFFFDEQLSSMSLMINTWNGTQGLGKSIIPRLWIDLPFHFFTVLLSRMGLSWFIIDKLWWGLILILLFFSMYKLSYFIFRKKILAISSSFFYILNTYVIMGFDGGQLGLLLGISFVPFVLLYVYKFFIKPDIFKAVLLSLVISINIVFDLRIAYIAILLCIGLFALLLLIKKISFHWSYVVIIPIIFLLHSYWIIPTIYYPFVLNNYSVVNNSFENLKFFSFADFTHTISLLHPNWPENLFGKTSFFRTEYLALPLFTFSILLKKRNRTLIYMLLLIILMGAFLAKGVNEPFGIVYLWLFENIPGFSMFRDPTKWYVFILLGYSLLTPYVFKELFNKYSYIGILLLFIVVLIPLLSTRMKGNITPPRIDNEMYQLNNLITEKPGKTLWLPTTDIFAYKSNNNVNLIATDILNESSPAGIIRQLKNSRVQEKIRKLGVNFIIIPQDIEQKIFLSDYKYDSQLRSQLVNGLHELGYEKINQFSKLDVFQVNDPYPLMTSEFGEVEVKEEFINIYNLKVPRSTKRLLISWNFDPGWVITYGKNKVQPQKTEDGLLQFQLLPNHLEEMQLIYQPQQTTYKASILSMISWIGIISFVMIHFLTQLKKAHV